MTLAFLAEVPFILVGDGEIDVEVAGPSHRGQLVLICPC